MCSVAGHTVTAVREPREREMNAGAQLYFFHILYFSFEFRPWHQPIQGLFSLLSKTDYK